MAKNKTGEFEVGQAVVISDGGDLDGFQGSVWVISGDSIGVKYKFFGACKPAGEPAVFSASELTPGGTGPCAPPANAIGKSPANAFASSMKPTAKATRKSTRSREYCCEAMQDELESKSEKVCSVYYYANVDEIGIVYRPDAKYYIPIYYCPWCGKKIGSEDNGDTAN